MYRILQLKFTAIRGVEVGVKCVRFQSRVRRNILSMVPPPGHVRHTLASSVIIIIIGGTGKEEKPVKT